MSWYRKLIILISGAVVAACSMNLDKYYMLSYSETYNYVPERYALFPQQEIGIYMTGMNRIVVGTLTIPEATERNVRLFTPTAVMRNEIMHDVPSVMGLIMHVSFADKRVPYPSRMDIKKHEILIDDERNFSLNIREHNYGTEEDPVWLLPIYIVSKQKYKRDMVMREGVFEYKCYKSHDGGRAIIYIAQNLAIFTDSMPGAMLCWLYYDSWVNDTINCIPKIKIDSNLRTHLCDSLAPTADIARRRIILTADSMEVIPDLGRRRIYRR